MDSVPTSLHWLGESESRSRLRTAEWKRRSSLAVYIAANIYTVVWEKLKSTSTLERETRKNIFDNFPRCIVCRGKIEKLHMAKEALRVCGDRVGKRNSGKLVVLLLTNSSAALATLFSKFFVDK